MPEATEVWLNSIAGPDKREELLLLLGILKIMCLESLLVPSVGIGLCKDGKGELSATFFSSLLSTHVTLEFSYVCKPVTPRPDSVPLGIDGVTRLRVFHLGKVYQGAPPSPKMTRGPAIPAIQEFDQCVRRLKQMAIMAAFAQMMAAQSDRVTGSPQGYG